MSRKSPKDETLLTFLELLQSARGEVPQGGLRRTLRTARAAARTGLGVLSGKFRGNQEAGLGAVEWKTIAGLVTELGALKGLAMKAGQILSFIDETLPPEMRELLGLLQTQSQPTPFEDVESTIREDLGARADDLLSALERKPVSSASIGQVHRGRLPNGTDVAVKVLHPGVREALKADFKMARLGPVFARLLTPAGAGSVKGFVAEIKARMLEECDYMLEASRQELFRQLFQDDPVIVVPRVHPRWSSTRVLVSDWHEGVGLEQFVASRPTQEQRNRFGGALFRFYFGTLYVHGLFHADPHPGNYAFLADGRLVVFDFGCAREFDPETVASLVDLCHAVQQRHEAAIAEAVRRIGGVVPVKPREFQHLRLLLEGFFGPLLRPGPHRIDARTSLAAKEVLRNKRLLMKLQLPGKLLFLFRIRFGLYAVLARLGASCDWAAMETQMANGHGRFQEGRPA